MPQEKEESQQTRNKTQVVDYKVKNTLDPRQIVVVVKDKDVYCDTEGDCSKGWYYKDVTLRLLYKHSPFLTLNFRKDVLPKRCACGYNILYNMLFKYMKETRKRVNKKSIAKVTNCLVKNVSRTAFYHAKGLRYNRDESWWLGNKNSVSNGIFLEFISLLESEGLLKSYSGLYGSDKYSNISSLLTLSTELVNICTGHLEDIPRLMEDCLKHYVSHYVIIRTKVGKTKLERPLVKGEIMKAKKLEKEMKEYHEALERHELTVNGKIIQDLYFRSIFTEDFNHGGRLADHGQWQSKTKKERKTLKIDGCDTISLDYKHLHPSILYAQEGIDLKGFDPYACKVRFEVDLDEVFEFAYDYDLLDCYDCTYDPNRNLAKVALLCMINAESEDKAIKAISKELRDDTRKQDKSNRKFIGLKKPVRVKEVVKELTKSNHQISKYFFTGHGVKLQNLDSKMIRYCVQSLLIEDKILLPVHDSISVKKEDQDLGMDIMYEAYEHVVGTDINCKVEVE